MAAFDGQPLWFEVLDDFTDSFVTGLAAAASSCFPGAADAGPKSRRSTASMP